MSTVVANQIRGTIPDIKEAVKQAVKGVVEENTKQQKQTWAGLFKAKEEETAKVIQNSINTNFVNLGFSIF